MEKIPKIKMCPECKKEFSTTSDNICCSKECRARHHIGWTYISTSKWADKVR